MFKQLSRRRVIVAAVAVPAAFLLIAGSATASALITSKDIKNQAIQSWDIARGAVAASEIRNGSIRPWDLDPELRQQVEEDGPAGPQGPSGPQGDKGDPGLSELEADGPYPGATQLQDGATPQRSGPAMRVPRCTSPG